MLRIALFSVLFTSVLVQCLWVPESGADWTQLRPHEDPLHGSLDTVPFSFGIVVNPYKKKEDGDYEKPSVSSVVRSITTTVTMSIVTPAEKPTKVADIIQISDGQIQRHNGASDEQTSDATDGDDCQESDEQGSDDADELLAKRENQDSYGEDQEDHNDEHEDAREDHKDDHEDYHEDEHEDHHEDHHEDEEDHQKDKECCDDDEEPQNSSEFVSPVYTVACATNTTLQMTLENSILRDSNGRIGSIVSGHQFQFDGPVPQYGAIYAAGWYITESGQLALGNSTEFYQCASGEFYNLYHEPIGLQCNPVSLDVVELIEC
ncbi:uncharacterized protein RJT20DRAFT_154302 [Scheffersomyces xylosifermentans]|uniref:uncharacterized protein n=1 Tax=Scheffersomyces xylosifermentans TaxID=1304137 RepID=UPI00315D2E70